MEIIVASSLLGSTQGEVEKRDYADDVDKWKQAGIVGASAMAGGTAKAVTGGIFSKAMYQTSQDKLEIARGVFLAVFST